MKPKEEVIGFCKLCGEKKKLTFEHIPPRVAFNKTTKYYSIPSDEYYSSKNLLKLKPKGNVIQGGVGLHCLCKDCNSFLGQNYVRPYSDFVNIGMSLLFKFEFDTIFFKAKNQNPLRVLKQVASMFISISEPIFKEKCPEIIDFVRKPEKIDLSEKYRFFIYLNNEGNYRKFGFPTITNQHGVICELAYPPFGFVLSIDSNIEFRQLTEITNFKNFNDNRNNEFDILINKLPTHIQIPLDFRKKDQIPIE